ncbi:MAG: hypothetical protein V7636_1130, partial [Actinomycetota bacterium]
LWLVPQASTIYAWNDGAWGVANITSATTLPDDLASGSFIKLTQADGPRAAGIYKYTRGAVTISATGTPKASATTTGNDGGVLAVGVATASTDVSPVVQAYAGDHSSIHAGSLNVSSTLALPSAAKTGDAEAFGTQGALVGDKSTVTTATTTAKDADAVLAYVAHDSTLDIDGIATIAASSTTAQKALSNSHAYGLISAGSAEALAKSEVDTTAYIGDSSTVTAHDFNVTAVGNDDNYAEATAGSGAGIAGAGVRTETVTTANVLAQLGTPGGSLVVTITLTGGLTLGASHTATYNTKAVAEADGVFAGSGANVDSTVTSNVDAIVGNHVSVSAGTIEVTATNDTERPDIAGDNISGHANSVASAAGATSDITLALETRVTIKDNASLITTGEPSGLVALRLAAKNIINGTDTLAFETGGALAGAGADATFQTSPAEAIVDIGDATLDTQGSLLASARTEGNVKVTVAADTYGAATVTVGTTTVDIRPKNEVHVRNGAALTALGDLSLTAGRSTEVDSNLAKDPWTIEARWDGFAGSAIPIDDVQSQAFLIITNNVTVDSGAILKTARQANLYAQRDALGNVTSKAKAVSWVSAAADGISSLLGGAGEAAFKGDALNTAHGIVTMNGEVHTGIARNISIMFDGWNAADPENPVLHVTLGATTNPDVLVYDVGFKPLESDLAKQLSNAQFQYNTYKDDNSTLAAFYQSEITRITTEMRSQGLIEDVTVGGKTTAVDVSRDILVITLHPIFAEAGMIDIRGDVLQGTGTFDAPGDVNVTIENKTPAFLEIMGVDVPDVNGGVLFNGVSLSASMPYPTGCSQTESHGRRNVLVDCVNAGDVSADNSINRDGHDSDISATAVNFTFSDETSADPNVSIRNTLNVRDQNALIAGNKDPNAPASATSASTFMWPDITILGPEQGGLGIFNDGGTVTLETFSSGGADGDVNIKGTVRAKNLTIIAGGDVFIDGVSIQPVGGEA